eukprot:jgi/Mesvir1/20725/Mv08600-RA.1
MERLRKDKDALSEQHADVISELEKARAQYDELRETHAAELRRVREEAEEQTRSASDALESLRQKHSLLSSVEEGLRSQLEDLQSKLITTEGEAAASIREKIRQDLRLVCKTIEEKRSCNPYKKPRLNRTIRFLPNSQSLTIPQPRSSPWPQRECRNGSSKGSKETNMQK